MEGRSKQDIYHLEPKDLGTGLRCVILECMTLNKATLCLSQRKHLTIYKNLLVVCFLFVCESLSS